MDRYLDGWIDRWIDRQINRYVDEIISFLEASEKLMKVSTSKRYSKIDQYLEQHFNYNGACVSSYEVK